MKYTEQHIFLFPQLDDELIKSEKFTIEYIKMNEQNMNRVKTNGIYNITISRSTHQQKRNIKINIIEKKICQKQFKYTNTYPVRNLIT